MNTVKLMRYPWLSLLIFVMVGCGDGRIRTYPTSGTVLVDGRPASGAKVIFCPTTGEAAFMKERPWGTADENGEFELTTFKNLDGAPAGEYTVMIRWPGKPRATASNEDPERIQQGADQFKGRYFHPTNSGLTATVEPKTNELAPFELTLKATR